MKATLGSIALLASFLLPLALADVEFTSPTAGQSVTGLTLNIKWQDSGDNPPIEDLATYQMFLCAGGNDPEDYIQLATLEQQGDFADGSSISVPLTAGLGASTRNAYFIKVMSAATGGVVTNFSPRFTLASMTGTFPPAVIQGLATVSGTAGPETINQVSSPQVGAAPSAVAGAEEYNVPYTMQTGQVRYAPMPPLAPTKITAKNPTPQWPTSAYTVFLTEQGPPNAITTETLAQTFKVSSREPTMAAQSQPAMEKFLNRWKD